MQPAKPDLRDDLTARSEHWLFQVDDEDMDRMVRKVDAIAARLGLEPDEESEPAPERHQQA